MARQSFAEKMNDSKLMISGVKQQSDRLTRRGLDSKFVEKYERIFGDVQNLDREQERLKATLKKKTETLQGKAKELKALYSEAKKIVKIEMKNSAWREFGIQDKK